MFDQNTPSIFGAQGFDSTQVAPSEDFSPVPPGEYPAIITGVEVKKTKAGTVQYLALEFTISAGPCQGRKIWNNLNLINPNPKAVEIAQRDLSAICQAVGKPRVQHESELMNCSITLKVAVKDDRNEVKAYKPAAAPTQAAPTPAYNPPQAAPTPAYNPPQAQPAAPAAPAPMPWG